MSHPIGTMVGQPPGSCIDPLQLGSHLINMLQIRCTIYILVLVEGGKVPFLLHDLLLLFYCHI